MLFYVWKVCCILCKICLRLLWDCLPESWELQTYWCEIWLLAGCIPVSENLQCPLGQWLLQSFILCIIVTQKPSVSIHEQATQNTWTRLRDCWNLLPSHQLFNLLSLWHQWAEHCHFLNPTFPKPSTSKLNLLLVDKVCLQTQYPGTHLLPIICKHPLNSPSVFR